MSADIFANTTLRGRIVTCTPDASTACAEKVIGEFGAKAFRRPVSADESAGLLQKYKEAFPNYPSGDRVIAALRAALAEGRIRAGLPGDFYHGNPMITKNRDILIDPRSKLVESRVSSLLAHEGQHLGDRDFSSTFARERRAFDVQYGFGRALGLADRRKTDAEIRAEYGY